MVVRPAVMYEIMRHGYEISYSGTEMRSAGLGARRLDGVVMRSPGGRGVYSAATTSNLMSTLTSL